MTALKPVEQKRALRMRFRGARKSFSKVEAVGMNRELVAHILGEPRLKRFKTVAAYWAMDGEPDLAPLLKRLPARGIKLVLPVIGPGTSMSFHRWEEGAPMRYNQFGIPEPAEGVVVPLEKIDLALMPLVAWDRSGRRLGMGGGYYDKAFKKTLGLDRPWRVGVAWSAQETEGLPQEAWDVSMHNVVTEQGWFTCDP